ncbi:HepT-like ribonuclease domain-containing protein [Nafulsella turpanensis]|uniref:HepT-like ribonuclease domain-containing protein n=1 Tax=Nafulsella turpanensis TaxID=1265690 RepID=UPI0003466F8F|nr:HepT-like ribonuclease domain-containing protein [Nafulsella turpanensis]
MTQNEDRLHIQNIIRSAVEIDGYTKGMDYEDYTSNESVRTAVATNLSMIGNEAAQLSDEFKNQYDEIDMRVLENLKRANYNEEMELDHHYVWNIATQDLPLIREKLSDVQTRFKEEEDIKGTTQDTTRHNLK